VLVGGSGCTFLPGTFGTTSKEDAAVVENDADKVFMDARPDTPSNQTCYGAGLALVCHDKNTPPTNTYSPSQSPINTSNDNNCTQVLTQPNGPELCVVLAQIVSISNDTRYSGGRPIVLVGTDRVEINGEIDVSQGAGANTGACSGGAAGVNDTGAGAVAGAGGGGGGGFGDDGADGGDGNGGNGGNGSNKVDATYVRGGCPGFKGGNSSSGTGGARGEGGGGIYLISGVIIEMSGSINASGGGGRGGPNKGGGGGGGAGGLIGFDAPDVRVSGYVFANGGGGGEGGGGGSGGMDGQDPPFWNQIPDGGSGNSAGGNGGNGAYTSVAAVVGSNGTNGGGGGGGGPGRIVVYATTNQLGTAISPAPVVTNVP